MKQKTPIEEKIYFGLVVFSALYFAGRIAATIIFNI